MTPENLQSTRDEYHRIMVIGEMEKAKQLAASFEELAEDQQIINNQINVAVLNVPDYSTATALSILNSDYLAVVSFKTAELNNTRYAISHSLKAKSLDDKANYYLAKNSSEDVKFMLQDKDHETGEMSIDELKIELKNAMLENICEA